MYLQLLLLLTALCSSHLDATATVSVRLKDGYEELRTREHQRVNVRGFLYQRSEGQWILAAEPKLKSCCVGASHKSESQFIVGFTEPPLKAPLGVCELEGTIELSGTGAGRQMLLLRAEFAAESGSNAPLWIAAFGILSMSTLFWNRRRGLSKPAVSGSKD